MYKEKLTEQIKLFEEKQKQCDNAEDIIKFGNAIYELACKIDIIENLDEMRKQFNNQARQQSHFGQPNNNDKINKQLPTTHLDPLNNRTKSKTIDVSLKFNLEKIFDKLEKAHTEFSKQMEKGKELNWARASYLLGLMENYYG